MNKSSKLSIIPVMLCFFAMGFVDLVGIASNSQSVSIPGILLVSHLLGSNGNPDE